MNKHYHEILPFKIFSVECLYAKVITENVRNKGKQAFSTRTQYFNKNLPIS